MRGLAGLSAATERIFDDIFHGRSGFRARAASAGIPYLCRRALVRRSPDCGSLTHPRDKIRTADRRSGDAVAIAVPGDGQVRRRRGSTPSFAAKASKRFPSRWSPCAARFPTMAKAAEELRERQHPSEWSAAFSKLLRARGWPGDRPLNPAEHQTMEHWKNLSVRTRGAGCGAAAHDLRPSAAAAAAHRSRSALRSARRRRAGSDHGHARSGGIAIRRAVDRGIARRSVAGGAASQSISAVVAATPAGMPHSSPERELAYARRVTARLLASAPEVVCSYPLFSGEEKLRVSPLIEALPEASESRRTLRNPVAQNFRRRGSAGRQPLGQAPPLAARYVSERGHERSGGPGRVSLPRFCEASPAHPRV